MTASHVRNPRVYTIPFFETVVDEEFGRANGKLADGPTGDNGDAAAISEPSLLRICPVQRGGRTVHITFSAARAVS